jgi:hypothetical protein
LIEKKYNMIYNKRVKNKLIYLRSLKHIKSKLKLVNNGEKSFKNIPNH